MRGIAPSYEQKHFDDAEQARPAAPGRLARRPRRLGDDPRRARVYAGLFDGDERASLALDPARKAYVHVVRGELDVNGQRLAAGDAACSRTRPLSAGGEDAEVLVFDLADE